MASFGSSIVLAWNHLATLGKKDLMSLSSMLPLSQQTEPIEQKTIVAIADSARNPQQHFLEYTLNMYKIKAALPRLSQAVLAFWKFPPPDLLFFSPDNFVFFFPPTPRLHPRLFISVVFSEYYPCAVCRSHLHLHSKWYVN